MSILRRCQQLKYSVLSVNSKMLVLVLHHRVRLHRKTPQLCTHFLNCIMCSVWKKNKNWTESFLWNRMTFLHFWPKNILEVITAPTWAAPGLFWISYNFFFDWFNSPESNLAYMNFLYIHHTTGFLGTLFSVSFIATSNDRLSVRSIMFLSNPGLPPQG